MFSSNKHDNRDPTIWGELIVFDKNEEMNGRWAKRSETLFIKLTKC